jgi:site-specific DNA recombinase
MKVVTYCRTSLAAGAQKHELANQAKKLKKFCEERKWKIIEKYEDVCGGFSCNRPALKMLMKDAKDCKFDMLLIYDWDRLSRYTTQCIYLADKIQNECGIKITTYKYDKDNKR